MTTEDSRFIPFLFKIQITEAIREPTQNKVIRTMIGENTHNN